MFTKIIKKKRVSALYKKIINVKKKSKVNILERQKVVANSISTV